uniref:Uncharacterized protein n=2 Tax=Canis lupus TaxID=9612 RepID=A0A8C0Q0T7_CANLF
IPKGKVSSTQGGSKGGVQKEICELSATNAPATVETKPKKVAGKDKPSDKTKCKQKGERRAKGRQSEVVN